MHSHPIKIQAIAVAVIVVERWWQFASLPPATPIAWSALRLACAPVAQAVHLADVGMSFGPLIARPSIAAAAVLGEQCVQLCDQVLRRFSTEPDRWDVEAPRSTSFSHLSCERTASNDQ
jgi:hypothetical protein